MPVKMQRSAVQETRRFTSRIYLCLFTNTLLLYIQPFIEHIQVKFSGDYGIAFEGIAFDIVC